MKTEAPGPNNQFHQDQVRLILDSYHHWTGEDLFPFPASAQENLGEQVFIAPFALVSHGTEDDPIFNYANRLALEVFGYPWEEWITLPSRFSAEAPNREARQKLLDAVREQGFSDGYQGIRIGKKGRFEIRAAKVWNLADPGGNARGQAACFIDWRRIQPTT
ncbi:MAG: hypothetical protein RLZ25_441 [Pseudomonadota bacterium]